MDEFVVVTLGFSIVDRKLFEAKFARLQELDTCADYGDDPTDQEKAEAMVVCLDVLALDAGRPIGWLDLGMER